MDLYKFKSTLTKKIWEPRLDELPRGKAWTLKSLRVAIIILRDWWEGQLALRATGLVYITLLSMVPLLALAFSVVKAFGMNNIIAPLLQNMLAPLGEKGAEVAGRLLEFVQNMRVGVLGSLGLIFLLYTVLSMIGQIADSLNYIWRVKETRPMIQRFNQYLSVLLIGPVLVVAAIGITASITDTELVRHLLQVQALGVVAYAFSQILPYILISIAFIFIYAFMPNMRVNPSAAFIGGVVAGFLWGLVGWVFASLVVTSTRYDAIYSSFAILIMFLIWIYLNWLIMLLGASVSFYVQFPEYLRLHGALKLSIRVKEKLALLVLYFISLHYRQGLPPWTIEKLSSHFNVATEAVEYVVLELERTGVLLRNNDDPPCFVPARALEIIKIIDVLNLIRTAGEEEGIEIYHLPANAKVDALIVQIDSVIDSTVENRTFSDLTDTSSAHNDKHV